MNKRNQTLTYSPNIKYNVGLGFYLFEIGFQFVVAIPRSTASIKEFGESNSIDLQANLIGNCWGIDAFTENYKGYFVVDSSDPKASGIPKLQRRDVETWNNNASGFYFFNKRRFSVRAIYNLYERQLKSAGSFLVMANYNRFVLQADSTLYGQFVQSQLHTEMGLSRTDYSTIAAAPGYAYNFVVKNWFAGASAALGPSVQWFNYEEDGLRNSLVQVRPYLNWRATVGFNSDRLFATITYTSQTVDVDYTSTHFASSSASLRMTLGYRFREVGILKKRVSEFIKPKNR